MKGARYKAQAKGARHKVGGKSFKPQAPGRYPPPAMCLKPKAKFTRLGGRSSLRAVSSYELEANLTRSRRVPPLHSVHPRMVDFGSGQGLSDFETIGITCYFEDFKRSKTPIRAERCCLWMDTT